MESAIFIFVPWQICIATAAPQTGGAAREVLLEAPKVRQQSKKSYFGNSALPNPAGDPAVSDVGGFPFDERILRLNDFP